jgi:hypothetical protein
VNTATTTARVALATVVGVLALVLAFVPAALAGKAGGGGKPSGGSTSGSTMSLVLMDGATQVAHYGRITFDVSTTATDEPEVGLRCSQGSNWVYDSYVGYFPGYMFTPWFTLDSGYWVDGVPATCDARLFYNDRRGRQIVLATMSFPVAP